MAIQDALDKNKQLSYEPPEHILRIIGKLNFSIS
jgi:hypothetical protein